MIPDQLKAQRRRNLRTALIAGSIALAGFAGIILRTWLQMK